MPPADLQVNIDQRQLLEDTADRAAFVKAGDVVEPFTGPEVLGGTVELDRLLGAGPVGLLFFRYEGCPACNIALRYYQSELYPALPALGVTLVALSPQVPDRLAAIKNRFGFGFPVVSDTGNGLARRFGITFTASPASQAHHRRDRPGPGGPVRGRAPRLAGADGGGSRHRGSAPAGRRPGLTAGQESCVRRLYRLHRPGRGPSCPRSFVSDSSPTCTGPCRPASSTATTSSFSSRPRN